MSRSFAFCIEQLEGELRLWVSLTYLICRLLDTVEDAPWPPGGEGLNLKNQHFDLFLKFLRNDEAQAEIPAWIAAFPEGITPGEKLLVADSVTIFSDLHALSRDVQSAIFKTAETMKAGMNHFAERARMSSSSSLRLKNITEVNQYCYFVAGVVGELLTRLVAISNPETVITHKILENSLHFGLFLQKVNLLKDQSTDEKEGRFLVPSRELLWESALENAERSFEYLLTIPKSERGYRVFCAWSLFLGLYSLPFIKDAEDSESIGKVPKELMWPLLEGVEAAISDDAALGELFTEALQECQLSERSSELSDNSSQDSEWFVAMAGAPIPRESLTLLRLI